MRSFWTARPSGLAGQSPLPKEDPEDFREQEQQRNVTASERDKTIASLNGTVATAFCVRARSVAPCGLPGLPDPRA